MRLQEQTRWLRGLRSRWEGLRRSHSLDSEQLRRQSASERERFATASLELAQNHEAAAHQALTAWDTSLDDSLASAERATLSNLGDEQQLLDTLKRQFKQSRNAEKSQYQAHCNELQLQIDQARRASLKKRDMARAKLERDRLELEEHMHDAREWVGVKTGSPALIHWIAEAEPNNAATIQSIGSLDEVARLYQECKQSIDGGLQRLKSHPALKLVHIPILVAIGIVVGALTTFVGYEMQLPPLIWGTLGVSALLLTPALLALAASPIITRTHRRLFPPIVEQEKLANQILQQGRRVADIQCQTEVAKLEGKHATDLRVLDSKHRAKLLELEDSHELAKKRTATDARAQRAAIAADRAEGMARVDRTEAQALERLHRDHGLALEDLRNQFSSLLADLNQGFERSQSFATRRWSDGVATLIANARDARSALELAYPDWTSTVMQNGTWPRSPGHLSWPIGSLRLALNPSDSGISDAALTQYANELALVGPMPIAFDLLHHGAMVLQSDVAGQSLANDMVRDVVLRAVTSLPAGSLHVSIIDPEGLGKRFSWLMHLADIDPTLVNHRVWTQPVHIADQLELTARHIEDVIQQSLRNNFRNLHDYNQQAGPMAIPYRLLVWSNFPFGLDEHSWQSLCSILSSGGRCGVGIILQMTDNCKWPSFADRAKLEEFGLHLELRRHDPQDNRTNASGSPIRVSLVRHEFSDFPLTPRTAPDELTTQRVMEHHIAAASQIGKRVVPFDSIAPKQGEVQAMRSSSGLEIPIGISDSGRTQCLRLGSGTSQHVLIAGKTGSGKSSLLHTIVSSAALQYSPEELRLVLLDFKKGVEFQVYAELQLAHTDIIGIESRREFGLSVLEYLDRILSARGEAFRGWGVQDLPSLARKHPEVRLPRILIVIDEFQELFVEDDKISQQASMLLDRLVRQGRSFGMHLILASQTLGGSYSLPRTTLSQMAVRIALQCDSSDAMLILGEDNNAAERLRHSGQGIYNEMGGRLEGNQNFQVSFLEKPEQLIRLGMLTPVPIPHVPTINPLGRRLVFEGHKPSVWDAQTIAECITGLRDSERVQLPWLLGDSVSIEPPILQPFARNAGRSAMIVGPDESVVAGMIASWIESSRMANAGTEINTAPCFWILDGSRPEDSRVQSMLAWAQSEPSRSVRVESLRGMESMFSELSQELSVRLGSPQTAWPSRVLVILNLARFRDLRRSDEYSYAAVEEGTLKPDAVLSKLLSDGPSVGLHVCIWSDSTSSLNRWISRASLRDIELRILMQMSAADSNQLIDSNAASRLDRHVLLVHDDADGKSTKFRPFDVESILMAGKMPTTV